MVGTSTATLLTDLYVRFIQSLDEVRILFDG